MKIISDKLSNESKFSKVINLITKVYFILGIILALIEGEGEILPVLKFLVINGGLLCFIIWKRNKLPIMKHQKNPYLKFMMGSIYFVASGAALSQILYVNLSEGIEFYNLDEERSKISIIKDVYTCENERFDYIGHINYILNKEDFIVEINELVSEDIELWKKKVAISTIDKSISNDIRYNKDAIFDEKNANVLNEIIESINTKKNFVYASELKNISIAPTLELLKISVNSINDLEEQLGDFTPNKMPFDISEVEDITAYVHYKIESNSNIANAVNSIVGYLSEGVQNSYYITNFPYNSFEGALQLQAGQYLERDGMYTFNAIQSGEMEVISDTGFKRSIPVYYNVSDEDMNWYYENQEKLEIYNQLEEYKAVLKKIEAQVDAQFM